LAKWPGNGMHKLLPALAAVSGGLAAVPATALELGELQVNSTLGQPLRASIAYALGPTEQLDSSCVTLQQGSPGGDLPTVSRAAIGVANGVISLTGKTAVREPLLTTRVNINCPYTARLSREYMLFIDPAGTAPVAVAAPVAKPAAADRPNRPAVARPATARTRAVEATAPGEGAKHLVRSGETLSGIAQGIENRPIGLWQAVTEIFEANPAAFIDNDPNKLKAGSWLSIPDFGNMQPATDSRVVASESPYTEALAGDVAIAYPGVDIANTVPETASSAVPTAVNEPATTRTGPAFADLQPGDVVSDSDNPFVSQSGPSGEVMTIIDIPLESPVMAASPDGPAISIQSPATATETSSWNWLLWLAGSGVAIIVALLLFGRRIGGRSTTVGADAVPPARRRTDSDTEQIEVISQTDFGLSDDSPTDENLVLDADLIAGTGLKEGNDLHVAQDFGFAATTALDMELPEEMSSGWQSSPTDIIPPLAADDMTILDSEVLPTDDDYSMSVIVDVTKMQVSEDVTERDLMAVPVETDDDTLGRSEYTVSKEVDFNILEQDYEDELTATQILNVEASKAAAELAHKLDVGSSDDTAKTPLATVTELDVTAQLPARDEDVGDLEDTGVNPEQTAEFSNEDKTVEMPANDSDVTVEMGVDSGKVKNKAG